MNGARVFEDAYSGVFREQEDFFSCLHEILGKSLWIRQKVRNLRLVPIIAGSTFEKELRSQYTEDGMDDGIITDTIANTALMLKYRGDMFPVRDCAIKSISESIQNIRTVKRCTRKCRVLHSQRGYHRDKSTGS